RARSLPAPYTPRSALPFEPPADVEDWAWVWARRPRPLPSVKHDLSCLCPWWHAICHLPHDPSSKAEAPDPATEFEKWLLAGSRHYVVEPIGRTDRRLQWQ